MSVIESWNVQRVWNRAPMLGLAAVVLVPLIPWLLLGPLGPRFNGKAALHSVADLAAIFALASWAVSLALASRVRPIERAFGGLEQLYLAHRRVGELLVILVVTHVVFITLYAGSKALNLYLPSGNLSTFSGVVALVLLIGFVVITLLNRVSYPTFLLVQRLLGVTFAIVAYHTFTVRGGAAGSSPALKAYLELLTAVGLVSLGYRLVGDRLGIGRRRYRVDEVHHLDDSAVEIILSPVGRALEYRAGQFVYATFLQDGIPRESHPFTIASAPVGPLRIMVKQLGDFTTRLMHLQTGAMAQLEGPFGSFQPLDNPVHAQTWIAGGIGITPFLSWARSLDGSTPADLYYCTPTAEKAYLIDELYAIADRNPQFRVIPIRKDSLGHLSVADFVAANPRVADDHVFICGPQSMIDNIRAGFEGLGIAPSRLHSENFDFR